MTKMVACSAIAMAGMIATHHSLGAPPQQRHGDDADADDDLGVADVRPDHRDGVPPGGAVPGQVGVQAALGVVQRLQRPAQQLAEADDGQPDDDARAGSPAGRRPRAASVGVGLDEPSISDMARGLSVRGRGAVALPAAGPGGSTSAGARIVPVSAAERKHRERRGAAPAAFAVRRVVAPRAVSRRGRPGRAAGRRPAGPSPRRSCRRRAAPARGRSAWTSSDWARCSGPPARGPCGAG